MNSRKYLNRSCFVLGCTTGYYSSNGKHQKEDEKSPSLFKAPKDTVLLEKWQRAIPKQANKVIKSNNVICSLHFAKEDILYFYETKLPDGTINRIERGRPQLKKGSIPSVFPYLPFYLSKNEREQKPPQKRNFVANIKEIRSKKTVASSSTPVEYEENGRDCKIIEQNSEEIDEHAIHKNLFEELKENLSTVCTPSEQWSGTFISGTNEILFAQWDDTYIPINRIVIRSDMSFKVFFGKSTVSLECPDMINCLNELENIMKSVDQSTL